MVATKVKRFVNYYNCATIVAAFNTRANLAPWFHEWITQSSTEMLITIHEQNSLLRDALRALFPIVPAILLAFTIGLIVAVSRDPKISRGLKVTILFFLVVNAFCLLNFIAILPGPY